MRPLESHGDAVAPGWADCAISAYGKAGLVHGESQGQRKQLISQPGSNGLRCSQLLSPLANCAKPAKYANIPMVGGGALPPLALDRLGAEMNALGRSAKRSQGSEVSGQKSGGWRSAVGGRLSVVRCQPTGLTRRSRSNGSSTNRSQWGRSVVRGQRFVAGVPVLNGRSRLNRGLVQRRQRAAGVSAASTLSQRCEATCRSVSQPQPKRT
jgi:hypothetical protein